METGMTQQELERASVLALQRQGTCRAPSNHAWKTTPTTAKRAFWRKEGYLAAKPPDTSKLPERTFF